MSDLVHARLVDGLLKLRMRHVAERIDALLADAAKREPTYLDFLDQLLQAELAAKQQTRIAMGITIAHFPTIKTLEEFDFKAQPSVDAKLVRELATGHFVSQAENVVIFGPPGVGKDTPRHRPGTCRRRAGAFGPLHQRRVADRDAREG